MADGWRTCEELADGPDHIIPGHDPLVLSRFPKLADQPDVALLHEPPLHVRITAQAAPVREQVEQALRNAISGGTLAPVNA